MRVVWSPAAERDRAAIWDYLEARNPAAALRIDRLIGETVAKLAEFPCLGRPGLIRGTRELIPHRNYRVVYEVVDETVWILTVVHTARLWPPLHE